MTNRLGSLIWQMLQHRLEWIGGGIGLSLVGLPVLALSTSVGADGIDALRLHQAPYHLTGRKIAIGQVEIGRPSQFGLDKVAFEGLPISVGGIFFRDAQPTANELVDLHATNVASVMVSQDKRLTGVAPDASLYSAAVGSLPEQAGQPEECLASQHVALQNGGDVRAMNFSFGESLEGDTRTNPSLDGNSLLTQCIDWSERVHDVLYVIAGNQGNGGIPIPTDNFNGINVAYSTRIEGRFVKLDFANMGSEPTFRPFRDSQPESNLASRRSISLVAPGNYIEMINPDGSVSASSGTSFAAPHVVATVALLQELGDRQFRAGLANWSIDSRRPMVMKAVLLNSADKLEDQGDGHRLDMARTLLDESNRNWLESDAYRDPKIPLHAELGTGHLNAYRAYQQFNPGQWRPASLAPVIGWNYDAIESPVPPTDLPRSEPAELFHDYVFEQPLQANSFISATLAWERLVVLNDANENGLYDLGDTFEDRGLNNMDLYLMRAEDTDIADSIWSSVSDADSVEHIFFAIPETGRYKLRVVYRQQVNDEWLQPYALAWWAVPAN